PLASPLATVVRLAEGGHLGYVDIPAERLDSLVLAERASGRLAVYAGDPDAGVIHEMRKDSAFYYFDFHPAPDHTRAVAMIDRGAGVMDLLALADHDSSVAIFRDDLAEGLQHDPDVFETDAGQVLLGGFVADMTGDGVPDVVVSTLDGTVYMM